MNNFLKKLHLIIVNQIKVGLYQVAMLGLLSVFLEML